MSRLLAKFSLLGKFWSLPRREKKFFCEAGILLSAVNICIKTVPFRHIDKYLRARWQTSDHGCIDREPHVRLVRRSISRAANVLPWNSLCLSRSITQFIMLRRRRIAAVLLAGARFSSQSSLDAHAWVDAG